MISIIVTVYNSEGILPETHKVLTNFLSRQDYESELIYVEDGSTDASWQVLREIYQTTDTTMRIIRLARNYGQFEAALCGIEYARGSVLVNIDDDLQFSPEDITMLLGHMRRNGLYLVYGISEHIFTGPWYVRLRNALLNRILGKTHTSSFRVFRREIIKDADGLIPTVHFEAFEKNNLNPLLKDFLPVSTNRHSRASTGYNFRKKLVLLLTYIFDYYPNLMHFGYYAGLAVFLFAAATFITPVGLETNGSILLFVSGLIICGIGFLGTYATRIMRKVNQVKYVVLERHGF